jgi:hypothetical protein
MDYYDRIREANLMIDELLMEGKSKPEIIFKLSIKFGFGEKFYLKRIKELDELTASQK